MSLHTPTFRAGDAVDLDASTAVVVEDSSRDGTTLVFDGEKDTRVNTGDLRAQPRRRLTELVRTGTVQGLEGIPLVIRCDASLEEDPVLHISLDDPEDRWTGHNVAHYFCPLRGEEATVLLGACNKVGVGENDGLWCLDALRRIAVYDTVRTR